MKTSETLDRRDVVVSAIGRFLASLFYVFLKKEESVRDTLGHDR